MIDILVPCRRNRTCGYGFFRKLLKAQGPVPLRVITDALLSYRAAHGTVMPSVEHSTRQYEKNRVEVSHQPTRLGRMSVSSAADTPVKLCLSPLAGRESDCATNGGPQTIGQISRDDSRTPESGLSC